jgi:hypothetical protein
MGGSGTAPDQRRTAVQITVGAVARTRADSSSVRARGLKGSLRIGVIGGGCKVPA